MEPKVVTDYDVVHKIFFKKYIGKVSLESIFKSWDEIIHSGLILDKVKRFIIDYSDAKIDIPMDKINELADFFRENGETFDHSKIAMIMISPEQVVFPYMLELQELSFTLKTFYTRKAAIEWLIRDMLI